MSENSEYVFDDVWENKTEAIQNEIVELWVSHGALPRQQALERVNQVFGLARDRDGTIVGVSTVYARFNKQLENSFYYYRSFVAPDHRREQLATNLLKFTRDNLEKDFVEDDDTRCIGMLVEVENKQLQAYRNQAVWPYTGFVYIGKNSRGAHIRVHYFKGARIS